MKEAKRWIRIARCRDIPLREGRAVKLGNRQIALFNLGDRFLAIENRCPHQGGPLADGIVSGAAVVCPLHGWKVSLDTGRGMNGASASSCLETFRTRVEDGMVSLEVSVDGTVETGGREDAPPACLEPRVLVAISESSPAV
jgi:nitrite reductase (NADH) small subunit